VWLIKAPHLSKGRGIRVLTAKEITEEELEHNADRIAQRYVADPLLIHGRKSELRLYWLVASTDPLLVLMYSEGTVRFTTQDFEWGNYDNPYVHLTNTYQQKKSAKYQGESLKWTFTELEAYLERPGYFDRVLKPKLHQILRVVAMAAQDGLCWGAQSPYSFGLYGADIILDSDLNPWLTEIQVGPGLSHMGDRVKETLIPAMLTDAVRVVFEVKRRIREGEDLSALDTGGYDWVLPGSQSNVSVQSRGS
jgi:hypothetical protein